MKLNNLKWAALCLIALASCSDDKKTEVDNPEGPQGDGTMEVMTPEESKVFLQDAAVDFLNKFKPEEQKALIELAAYYDSEYADYDLPDNFYLDDDDPSYSPARYLRQLAKAAKGDVDALTRAANSYSYNIKFDRFAGIYEPVSSREEWVKTGNSNDIIFRFTNKSAQPVELKISQSGGVSDLEYSYSEWDWEYDYNIGDYKEIEEKYTYYLSIPKNVTTTLTENGSSLANATVISSIDVKGHTLSANIDATLMNLRATAKVAGNDSKVEARTELYVSNEKIASAYATLEGSGLCDLDRYEKMEDLDDDDLYSELAKMFKSGDCGLDMLGEVQVYGQGTYYREMPLDLDGWFDKWDYESQAAALQGCQDACDRLNKSIKMQLRYNNTSTDQATAFFQPAFDDWGYGWEYYTDCVLLFPDDTKYSVEEYFKNFTTVSGKFDSLLDAYQKIWRQAKK